MGITFDLLFISYVIIYTLYNIHGYVIWTHIIYEQKSRYECPYQIEQHRIQGLFPYDTWSMEHSQSCTNGQHKTTNIYVSLNNQLTHVVGHIYLTI